MKNRRKCRRFIPYLYLLLQVILIIEGMFISYAILPNTFIMMVSIIIVAIILFFMFVDKTTHIINTRCMNKQVDSAQ